MTPADFTLSAVPLRGPLAPIVGMLGEEDRVGADAGSYGVWFGVIITRDDRDQPMPGWVWLYGNVWVLTPKALLCCVDLTTSPAARSAVVAWLASQGHTDAGKDDSALLSALRHVCGLPPAPPAVDDCGTGAIPF